MTASSKEKKVEMGSVTDALPNAVFKIRLDNGKEVLAHLAGKMRMYYIKVLVGDRVRVEFSPYDESRGRIIQRL